MLGMWALLAAAVSAYAFFVNKTLKKAEKIIEKKEADETLVKIKTEVQEDVANDSDQQLADRINARYKPNNTPE